VEAFDILENNRNEMLNRLHEQKMKEMKFIKGENADSIMMGILMSKLRGRISAKKVSEKVASAQRSLKNVKQ